MDHIEPEEWDVIIIGSGLPECLIASALAAPKDGKSILLIDEDDTYGSEYASFTLGSIEGCAVGRRTGATGPILVAESTGPLPVAEPQSVTESKSGEEPAGQPTDTALGDELKRVTLPDLALPLSQVEIYRLPGVDVGRERAFILDLLPKVCYQAESLVDILVRTRAHNYMEFKQVEGSYIYTAGGTSKGGSSKYAAGSGTSSATRGSTAPTLCAHVTAACPGGTLRPVPASKSDVFQDRSLTLVEKRQLMTFIGSTVEAMQGKGRLKDQISSGMPLIDLLKSESLPEGLRDIIMYGIAACDTDQQPSTTPDVANILSPTPSSLAGTPVSHPAPLSATQGAASLQLVMHSMGRFGAPGAFMVPGFGFGSVAEAFVRFSAVHGATTVLRQRVNQLLVKDGPTPMHKDGAKGDAGPSSDDTKEDVGPSCGEAKENPGTSCTTEGTLDDGTGAGTQASGVGGEGPLSFPSMKEPGSQAGSHVFGVVTAAGQQLRCKTLVAGCKIVSALREPKKPIGQASALLAPEAATAAPTLHAGSSACQPACATLSRALAVMDRSLVASKDCLMLVFPPLCPALGGTNRHAVRGLQLGPNTAVCPPGRFLLYLSTPAVDLGGVNSGGSNAVGGSGSVGAPPPTSRMDIQAALTALCQTHGLVSDSGEALPLTGCRKTDDGLAAGAPSLSDELRTTASTASGGSLSSEAASAGRDACLPAESQPRAIQVHCYEQCFYVMPEAGELGDLPSNVVCCGVSSEAAAASTFGLVGYGEVVAQTERLFRNHFPALPWLSEFQADVEAGAGERMEREEDLAVDDLESVISKLRDAEAPSGQEGASGGEAYVEEEGGGSGGEVTLKGVADP